MAQTYSNAVMQLNPVAYWPLNETAQPPQVLNLTATNSGTVGSAGNGYYGGWYQQSGNQWYLTNNIAMETGPVTGDQAMNCQKTQGQYIILPRRTNGVANAAVTITSPFSVEAWVNMGATSNGLMSIVSEGGESTMDTAGPNPTNQFYGGSADGWDGFTLGTYTNYFFFNCYVTNGESKAHELDSPHTLQVGQWVYVVCTVNNGVMTMYTNGVQAGGTVTVTANAKGLQYLVDPTSPLIIGAGPAEPTSYGNAFNGGLAEVAIYNQALSSTKIANHYSAAATGVASYTNAVLADSPTIYLRMNDGQGQTGAGYPSALFPVATNYGTLGATANGVYQQGTTPGVAGPPFVGFGSNSKSVAINGWFGAVDIGNSNLPSALNPTGAVPMSVVAWYQTGPADSPARFQEILGHSDSSYRLSLGATTPVGENHFNAGPGPEVQFTTAAQVITNGFALNDGNWHMVAGISDGTNEYLYLDGALALTNSNPTGINIVGTADDLLLGGDPEYTYPVWYNPGSFSPVRNLDGNIAQVSFFTNALSATQIQNLFNASGMTPYIWRQPVSSVTGNQGQTVTVTTGIRGAGTTYQWYTINGVSVSGQTGSSLVFTPAATNESGSYYVVATSASGAVTSSIVNITIYGAPGIIQQSLTQLEIFSNSTPTLYVTASGASLAYQWNLNGVAIPKATNSTYTVPSIQQSGVYGCAVTNFAGTNGIIPINITLLLDPTNPYPAQVLANHPLAYYRLDEAPGATTAFDYVGGMNGSYSNVNCGYPGYTSGGGSDPNETAPFFAQTAPPPPSYVGNVPNYLNFGEPVGSNGEFSVEAWVNENLFNGSGDCIVAAGYGGGGEQFVLDDGASSAGNLRFFVRDAATGLAHAANSSIAVGNDGLWHHVVGVCDEAGGHVYLYLDGTQVGSGSITAGSGIMGLTVPVSIGARESANNNPTNYDYQYQGYIDDVAIYNKALTAAQVQNDYYAYGVIPLNVQVQPSSLSTNQGATVTFTSSIGGGTPPFTYQWYDNNNSLIPNQTNATLVLGNVQTSQEGTYTLTVANDYGSTNVQVQLTVNMGGATIQAGTSSDIQPTNVIVYADTSVTLSVNPGGSEPFHAQWYRNGVAISGPTNISYTFPALLGTNTYYVVVTNAFSYTESPFGPAVSSTATVVGEPISTLNPANFNSRLRITFTGYTNSEVLQDFPALVRLSPGLPGFNYSEFAGPNGSDLRFTDSGGTNELAYEIVQWDDTNGGSTVWVQVPALSGGTNNYIWAYWGNPNDTTTPAYTTNGAVWEPASFLGLPGYEVVYHLQQTNYPYLDSTTNYPALNGGAVLPGSAPGIVGNGAVFSGSASQYLNAGDVNLGNQFTMSAWVDLAPTEQNIQALWCNGPGGFYSDEIAFFINDYGSSADGAVLMGTGDGQGTSPGVNGAQPETAQGLADSGSWHLVTAAVNRTNGVVQFYVDGKFAPIASTGAGGTAVTTDFPTNADMYLGRFTTANFPFNGIMDEARIHGGIDDSNWVWADYMTVANNSTFSTYSSVTNSITLPITLIIRVSGNQAILSWPGGTLQSAGQLNGPYSNVTGASSPYTNALSGTQKYYRVQAQF